MTAQTEYRLLNQYHLIPAKHARDLLARHQSKLTKKRNDNTTIALEAMVRQVEIDNCLPILEELK